MTQQHIFLGRDRRDAEAQRDAWLSENSGLKVLRLHPPKAEPRTLLTRIGGRNIPRVSIEVEYDS
jgi:very-short-patch-repair endonuclease